MRPPALALKGIGPYIWQLKTFCARALHFSRIPVRSLRTPVEPVTALAPAEAFTEMLPPMLPPRPLAPGTGQPVKHLEPALLALVEALIQGICGFRRLLQGRPRVGKGCGALPQLVR